MKATTKKWIEAAKLITTNAETQIECPECGIGKLTIIDVKLDKILDTYLICDHCGAKNVITILPKN